MLSHLKKKLAGEKGQALVIVLGLLAIGGLTIAVSVNYATTSLKRDGIIREDMGGVYAAGAGVEYALWSLQEGIPTANETPEDINRMAVGIQTKELGVYTLYLDDLIDREGSHNNWITVESEIVPVGGTTYDYTISIAREEPASGTIRLVEIGVVLPPGYTYVDDSAALFPANLSLDNPDSSGNTSGGAQWLKWLWNPGQGPGITGNHTQGFNIDGTGSTDDAYAWVVAQSQDIGIIGEISGTLYRITSTATRPEDGKTTAKIVVDTIEAAGTIYIFSWQISK
ncbi:hypothetical protein ACFLVJ_00975 [Chloroflexota bacterium]